jgi:hypothetical protein
LINIIIANCVPKLSDRVKSRGYVIPAKAGIQIREETDDWIFKQPLADFRPP